jgi:hypothetical protein
MDIKYSIGSGSLVKPDGFNNIFQKKRCTKNRVPVIAGWVDFFFYSLSDKVGICGVNPEKKYAQIGLRLTYLYPENP